MCESACPLLSTWPGCPQLTNPLMSEYLDPQMSKMMISTSWVMIKKYVPIQAQNQMSH